MHTKLLLACLIALYSLSINAQKRLVRTSGQITTETKKKTEPYRVVDQMPKFPGGTTALFKFIAANINYPQLALENDIYGKVFTKYVVKKDGTIGKIIVTRGVDPLLDKEAISIIRKLPRFKPALVQGKPVDAWFSCPVDFRLPPKNKGDETIKIVNTEEESTEEEQVFFAVEDMPLFQGKSSGAFRTYIYKNLQYPKIAQENGVSGRVFVQFDINKDGSLTNIAVIRGVDPLLDKEAIRVVKNSPKWTPGKKQGKCVKVRFTFPVIFRLQ